jgi:3-oxoacyl-[acyl-carrier protein] reductase
MSGGRPRTALVTAGTSGIGRAVAERLIASGVQTFVTGVREEHGTSVAKEIGAADYAIANFEEDGAGSAAARAALEALGSVDVLVSNTGGPRPGAFLDLTDEDWDRGYRLIVRSAIQLTRAVLPGMQEAGWGRIVYLTTTGVLHPLPNLHLSNVLRSAVTMLSQSIVSEVAPYGVTTNVIAPAQIDTERLQQIMSFRAQKSGTSVDELRRLEAEGVPARRLGKAEDVATLATFLCSDEAGYLSGGVYCVDGGSTVGS